MRKNEMAGAKAGTGHKGHKLEVCDGMAITGASAPPARATAASVRKGRGVLGLVGLDAGERKCRCNGVVLGLFGPRRAPGGRGAKRSGCAAVLGSRS